MADAAPPQPPPRPRLRRAPRRLLLQAASVACGIQFGWALQLSLLTPYVQELGVPHAYASLVWLCGPLSGLIVQPVVGLLSDRLDRRRKPFIVGGATIIAVAVLTIGFSADIGRALGDGEGSSRTRTIAVYIVGFALLDVGNNGSQGPCRALLADLTEKDPRRMRIANAYFSLFIALGNILGYATGSFGGWYRLFPFTVTSACSVHCANLKSAFILDVIILGITTYISIKSVQEGYTFAESVARQSIELGQHSSHGHESFSSDLLNSVKYFTLPIWIILIVTAVTWFGWTPFALFDTDWMGREVYRGSPDGSYAEIQNYNLGVRMGAFGLMLNSVVLAFTSVVLDWMCRKFGARLVWGISTLLISICFIAMIIITFIGKNMEYLPGNLPPNNIIVAALVVFSILGAPLAVIYSIPYAMLSARIDAMGLGQGLAMGVLNLAVVIPQVIVSLGSGPWDQFFGGGNTPSLAVAAVAAFASGLGAIFGLRRSYIGQMSGRR